MDYCFVKGEKGQVSIEFIFIFMIAIIYIFSVVEPGLAVAEASIGDVSNTSQTRLAASKLSNSINELLLSEGDGKKTINILVPEGGKIICDNTVEQFAAQPRISFSVALSEQLATVEKCTDRLCKKDLYLLSDSVTCQKTFSGKNFFTVIVKKENGEVNVE